MHDNSAALFLYREAHRIGAGQQLVAAQRAGRVVRLARGVYTDAAEWMSLTLDDQYRTRVRAAAAISAPRAQFSHDSAAALWHLPSIGPWPAIVHELVPRAAGGTSRASIRRHALGLDAAAAVIHGVTVTSLARTIVDMSCSTPFVRAVAMADHALRRGLAPEQLDAAMDALGDYRGLGRARHVARFATPLSESPGESFSRVQFYALGFPEPELQVEFFDERGSIGVADFFWRELGLIVEFDGHSKYGVMRRYQRSMTLEQILLSEKNREDRMRRVSNSFARLDWATVSDRRRLAAHVAPHGLVERGRSSSFVREPVSS